MYPASTIFHILFTKYKGAARPSFARFVMRFIFYMAYYCLKTRSNAIKNKLILIFCLLTDDLTSFQRLPCFHTCQCPVDDLQLISADDLQISCASLWLLVNAINSQQRSSKMQLQTCYKPRQQNLRQNYTSLVDFARSTKNFYI